jgi:hypothetical protein
LTQAIIIRFHKETQTCLNPRVPRVPLFFASVSTPTLESSHKNHDKPIRVASGGYLHIPRPFIISSHHIIRARVFLRSTGVRNRFTVVTVYETSTCELIIHPQFILHLLCSCLCSRLCLQGLATFGRSIRVAQIDNQHSSGVVTARV